MLHVRYILCNKLLIQLLVKQASKKINLFTGKNRANCTPISEQPFFLYECSLLQRIGVSVRRPIPCSDEHYNWSNLPFYLGLKFFSPTYNNKQKPAATESPSPSSH